MKLNIEELAREAGFVQIMRHKDGSSTVLPTPMFERFARLIVERCAQECVKERNTWADYSDGYAALLGFEQRLHNLMED